jgi:two-component system phosphate regulon sensor histidine kinase PhoR
MLEQPGSIAVIAIASAGVAGLLIGLGFWGWALLPAGFAAYLAWQVTYRSAAARAGLAQLEAAIAQLPEGKLPSLSSVPGVELIHLAATLEEMHERVQQRLTQLEHDRDRLQAVFTSMRDAVIALGSSGRIALINPGAERLFHVEAKEVEGRTVLEVIRHRQLSRAMQQALGGAQPITFEFETIDVPPRHLQAEVAPVRTVAGKLSGAVAVLHDVTQLRQLERIRSEFVANVSHELRTPITSIKGFLETLLDGAMHEPEVCERFLSILASETERLARLVDDLLELSRLEKDEAPMTLETLNLQAEATQALELVAPMAQEQGLTLALQVPASLQVKADASQLRQALLNLLDNAIKYTPQGGRVWIEGSDVAEDGLVTISVCDTGQGIPSRHVPRLFERFYRVDKARSRAMGGTGLGLSIVRHIVEQHGGQIHVESKMGHGSRFTIALPRHP